MFSVSSFTRPPGTRILFYYLLPGTLFFLVYLPCPVSSSLLARGFVDGFLYSLTIFEFD